MAQSAVCRLHFFGTILDRLIMRRSLNLAWRNIYQKFSKQLGRAYKRYGEPCYKRKDRWTCFTNTFAQTRSSLQHRALGRSLYRHTVSLYRPISNFSVDLLKQLSRHFPIDRMHVVVFRGQSGDMNNGGRSNWEGLLRNIFFYPDEGCKLFPNHGNSARVAIR